MWNLDFLNKIYPELLLIQYSTLKYHQYLLMFLNILYLYYQRTLFYIDKNNNVYQTEDIYTNKTNPKVIAKYVKNGDIYSIPEFDI